MNDASSTAEGKSPSTRMIWRSVLLVTAVLWGVFPAFAAYGYGTHGALGLAAAGFAAGACWFGALVGFAAMIPFQGPQAVNGVLLGMVVRMTVPLAAALWLFMRGSTLAKAGAVEMLVVYYLLALALDTLVSVRWVRQVSQRATKA